MFKLHLILIEIPLIHDEQKILLKFVFGAPQWVLIFVDEILGKTAQDIKVIAICFENSANFRYWAEMPTATQSLIVEKGRRISQARLPSLR